MGIDKESEEEFNDWLDSIKFIDADGKVVEPELTKDITEDPEGDRG